MKSRRGKEERKSIGANEERKDGKIEEQIRKRK